MLLFILITVYNSLCCKQLHHYTRLLFPFRPQAMVPLLYDVHTSIAATSLHGFCLNPKLSHQTVCLNTSFSTTRRCHAIISSQLHMLCLPCDKVGSEYWYVGNILCKSGGFFLSIVWALSNQQINYGKCPFHLFHQPSLLAMTWFNPVFGQPESVESPASFSFNYCMLTAGNRIFNSHKSACTNEGMCSYVHAWQWRRELVTPLAHQGYQDLTSRPPVQIPVQWCLSYHSHPLVHQYFPGVWAIHVELLHKAMLCQFLLPVPVFTWFHESTCTHSTKPFLFWPPVRLSTSLPFFLLEVNILVLSVASVP